MKEFINNIPNHSNSFFSNTISKYSKLLSKEIINSKILVIGGAGTIGSNYIKEILKFKPQKIVVVDINENGLTELTRDLRSSNLLDYNPDYITYPVNLLSSVFDKIFSSEKWDIVSNFSAHKHVRSEKDKISIEALIRNNVFGAIKLLNLCEFQKPNYFFSVSTDKAANPVNIMGASKSLMEKVIMSKMNNFRVSTARFANVAFSNGSLLDGFINRIIKKQPLSCPSDIKRFFVTPEQSGQICLLSTFLGESGSIFFPKLNFQDQIYFKKIAIDFLEFNSLKPKIFDSEILAKNADIDKISPMYPIYFFESNTSGEKKYEEFYTEEEDYNLKTYDSLGFINSYENKIDINEIKNRFEIIFKKNKYTKDDLIKLLKNYVDNFDHIETGKNLDQKM